MIKLKNNQTAKMRGIRGKNTHTTMTANKTGKQGTLRVCEKTPVRTNYTDYHFWMAGIKGKQKSFVGCEAFL